MIFSIQTKTRTLDLQSRTSEIRNRWVKFLKIIHKEGIKKGKIFSSNSELIEKKRKFKAELEEIWE